MKAADAELRVVVMEIAQRVGEVRVRRRRCAGAAGNATR
jgi:hypothetical protein